MYPVLKLTIFFFNLETANDFTSILKAKKVVRTYSILPNLRKLTTNPVSKHLAVYNKVLFLTMLSP